jgi:hypothetical protein
MQNAVWPSELDSPAVCYLNKVVILAYEWKPLGDKRRKSSRGSLLEAFSKRVRRRPPQELPTGLSAA